MAGNGLIILRELIPIAVIQTGRMRRSSNPSKANTNTNDPISKNEKSSGDGLLEFDVRGL